MWHEIIVDNEDRSIHNYFSDMLLEISNVKSGFLFYLCDRFIKEIISRRKKLLLKKHFPYQRKRRKFCIMYQTT